MIQFTEGGADRISAQKTLHDEFDQSTDYHAFKLEEIGAIKVELDQTQNELRQVNARNVELEDQTRRLKNDIKTIGKMHQTNNSTTIKSKIISKNAQTNTEPVKAEKSAKYRYMVELEIFETPFLSKIFR